MPHSEASSIFLEMDFMDFKSPYMPNVTLTTTPSWLLAKRACMTATVEQANNIAKMGESAWLDAQLNPSTIQDSVYEEERKRLFPTYTVMREPNFLAKYKGHKSWFIAEYIQSAEFHAAWRSQRQLQQTMISFWSDHVSFDFRSEAQYSSHDPAIAYRDHALGKFKNLLIELYTSSTIVAYLGNQDNTASGPNENLGRELLELHTVGVGANYTQADVVNSSRILSGYKGYYYNSWEHYLGPVQVMGFKDNNDRAEGHILRDLLVRYLTYLATHPSTARRICDRLVARFVSDTPKPSLSARLSAIYLSNDTDIRPVLKALFTSSEFKASAGQKIRRPMSVLTSVLAAGKITPKPGISTNMLASNKEALNMLKEYRWYLYLVGDLNHGWGPPDGYPIDSKKWLSSNYLLGIWRYLWLLSGDGKHTTPANWSQGLGLSTSSTYGNAVNQAASRMTGITLKVGTETEKALRTSIKTPAWEKNATLPDVNAKLDTDAILRAAQTILLSPLTIIS